MWFRVFCRILFYHLRLCVCSYRVVVFGRDDVGNVRVPQYQVSIRAHSNAALTRVQVEDFGCIGAGYSHKLILVHLTGDLQAAVCLLLFTIISG